MTHFEKLQTGFILGTISMGLMLIIGAFLQVSGISNFFDNFHITYVVPFVIFGYLFAPIINKFIKLK